MFIYQYIMCSFLFFSLNFLANCSDAFTKIYETPHYWSSKESVSGNGSELKETVVIRKKLPEIVKNYSIKTLLDAPCGDFNWMKEIDLPCEKYIGVDVVRALIDRNKALYGNDHRSFICLDMGEEALPSADLLLCRDCLVHHTFASAWKILLNIKRSGVKYLLVTTYPALQRNKDLQTIGFDWRSLNMQREPFNFPEPLLLIDEQEKLGKHLGLWRLEDIFLDCNASSKIKQLIK